VVFPKEASRGLTPAVAANATSERMRPWWECAAMALPQVMGPWPGWRQARRDDRGPHESRQAAAPQAALVEAGLAD
jgi:hypothetical protein